MRKKQKYMLAVFDWTPLLTDMGKALS